MGLAKRMLEEQDEKGYVLPEELWVCPGCITDTSLATAVAEHAVNVSCSYCGATGAAPLEHLLDEISEVIHAYFADPAEELPYCSREGGYQGTWSDGYDLVINEVNEWTDDDGLLDTVATAFSDGSWCRRDYFGLTEYEALKFGWDAFSRQVKHHTRFLFFPEVEARDELPDQVDGVRPERMLDALGNLFRAHNLFLTAAKESRFLRARVVKANEFPSDAQALGTAPRQSATRPNRMSPAGIPLFYCARDPATAIAETCDGTEDSTQHVAVAQFRATRSVRLLDLTQLPPIPSRFDRDCRDRRDPIRFLHAFASELSRPIERDESAHTEYAPTQIVTEFVRHRLRDSNGTAIDGIIYSSSRVRGHQALVLFAAPEDCGPREKGMYENGDWLLHLENVSYVTPLPR